MHNIDKDKEESFQNINVDLDIVILPWVFVLFDYYLIGEVLQLKGFTQTSQEFYNLNPNVPER
ncbi:hypothetical protein Anas_09207 [Armadillidium nasatum]|uniref:Uncharacterized protein n=1 Tax=Armadillidium nasatum TaxID=96803 RepID=A0A5N5T0D2_9CRUS|nr:hypothetical protein Anas_09207 [Armadillidium nasatum]